ncbi:MAG: hypothetical protein J5797_12185 [Prevotella sp.]|nr:hypothetical protein [Prevotella sp.]
MRDIPKSIIRERRDALIVLKEKKSKITLLNPDRKLYHEVKVDGDLYAVTETSERKCDYLEIGKETIDAFYIELKGIDVDSAYEQLLSTIRNVNVGVVRKKTAIVVTSHIPKINLKLQKYKALCKRNGAELEVVNSGKQYSLY